MLTRPQYPPIRVGSSPRARAWAVSADELQAQVQSSWVTAQETSPPYGTGRGSMNRTAAPRADTASPAATRPADRLVCASAGAAAAMDTATTTGKNRMRPPSWHRRRAVSPAGRR